MDEIDSTRNLRDAWNERLKALRNIPPVLGIVWEAGPSVVLWSGILRVGAGLVPLATLFVTRWIIDAVVAHVSRHQSLSPVFWWVVGLEFGLASLGAFLSRVIAYCDSLLADRYIRHISVRVMEHASRVDLTTYDDPAFYDQLERARVQATDRLVMIQAVGNFVQQAISTATLAAGIVFFSPWLLVILVVFVIPAFLGDSHFAFLGYALNFRLTPIRRELDYLRTLGASKESAKELKLFDLSSYLTGRYKKLSDEVYRQSVDLAGRKLRVGALLSVLTTVGYYSAYAYVIYRTLVGALSIGTLTFLAGAIAGASTNIQMMFSTFIVTSKVALTIQPSMRWPPYAFPSLSAVTIWA